MAVASPCIDLCRMDRKTGWCVGCLRTPDEIRGWTKMTDYRRHKVLAETPRRRRKLGSGAAPGEL